MIPKPCSMNTNDDIRFNVRMCVSANCARVSVCFYNSKEKTARTHLQSKSKESIPDRIHVKVLAKSQWEAAFTSTWSCWGIKCLCWAALSTMDTWNRSARALLNWMLTDEALTESHPFLSSMLGRCPRMTWTPARRKLCPKWISLEACSRRFRMENMCTSLVDSIALDRWTLVNGNATSIERP